MRSAVFSLSFAIWIASATAQPIVLVGGGDTAYPTGWFSETAKKKGAGMWAPLKSHLEAADLRFLNIESPVTTRKAIAKKRYPLVTHPRFLDIMVEAGFNLFSLANNHTGDAGRQGLEDTFANLERLRRKDRPLWWSGAGLTKAARKQPATFELNGQKIAFLSFRLSGSPLGNPMGKSAAEAQIRLAARSADIVIVSAHGGAEYKNVPGGWKAQKWRAFVDAGADVVLGHGPHNPQGVEWYKGAAIFYSLGNFSFGTRPPKRRTGGMLLRGLLARVTFEKGRVTRAEAVPLFVDNTTKWTIGKQTMKVRVFTPVPLKSPFFEAMLAEVKDWSAAIRGNDTKITACGDAYCFTAK